MNKPTATPPSSKPTQAHIEAPASAGSWKSTFILLLICLVALIGVCLYQLAARPNSLHDRSITPQPGYVAPTTPDAFGRPPGDPHYGHDHP